MGLIKGLFKAFGLAFKWFFIGLYQFLKFVAFGCVMITYSGLLPAILIFAILFLQFKKIKSIFLVYGKILKWFYGRERKLQKNKNVLDAEKVKLTSDGKISKVKIPMATMETSNSENSPLYDFDQSKAVNAEDLNKHDSIKHYCPQCGMVFTKRMYELMDQGLNFHCEYCGEKVEMSLQII